MTARAQDELLVLAAQDGDAGAMDALVLRWHGALLRQARRLLADADAAGDAVQEAWLQVVRGLWRLQDPASFPAWALRIVTATASDLLRRRGRQQRAEARAAAPESAPPGPGGGDEAALLRAAVAGLPAERRLAVELFYLEGLSVHEVGLVLAVPPGTVKSRLHQARAELRAALGGRCGSPPSKE